jgi:Nif-specific regulatory protein
VEINNLSTIRDIRRDQLELLYRISEMLNVSTVQDSLINQSLDLIIKFLKADRGLFTKYNSDLNTFSIVAARNIQQDSIPDLDNFSSGILRKVVSQKQACLYHDAQENPDVSQFKSIQMHNIKSIIGVPVFHQKNIWGVILVDSFVDRKEFTSENLFFLEFFANLVSLVLHKIIHLEALQEENLLLRNQLESSSGIPDMIGKSPAMKELANLINRVAQTDASVLLLGESGTGKELAARAIHKLSRRNNKPFLAQFCGSIPDTLLESELFGYKKGAFSGAYNDKMGLFEVANEGTFLLDEIADISPALQAKLLRVLESQEIMRLGDTLVKKIQLRIIAATNKNLPQFIKDGKFREDLYYRLNVFPVVLPPLRERKGDIPLLVKYFIQKNESSHITITKEALNKLEKYAWPGNVRQLENVIQRALILGDGKTIAAEHIIIEDDENISNFKGLLKDYEMLLLKNRLKQFDGNRTLTAQSLGVSVRWIQLKLKQMDL